MSRRRRTTSSRQPNAEASSGRQRKPRPWWLRLFIILLILALAAVILGRTGLLERLAYFPTRDTPPPPPGVQEAYVETSDGLRLHGWFAPARRDAGSGSSAASTPRATHPPPTLVLHGNAGNVSNHYPFVEFFPPRGFNVFVLDYRGYGKSDRGTLRREYLMRDAEAGLDYLLTRRDVDSRRIALYAQSLGGVFGSNLMAKREAIKAGIFVSVFTSWRDIAASVVGGGGDPGAMSSSVASLLMPGGLDPIHTLPKITDRPILIVHGTDDEIVPFRHGERLHEAVETINPKAEFRPVPGGDHNALRWIDPSIEDAMVDFLHRALAKE